MATRRFTCADCGHTFEVAYGTGTPGAQMTCPQCGSKNIHRAEGDRGYDRAGGAGRGTDAAGRARVSAGDKPARMKEEIMFKRLFGARNVTDKGKGRGRMGGECLCPCCGCRIAHRVSEPCNRIKCPECGCLMIRA